MDVLVNAETILEMDVCEGKRKRLVDAREKWFQAGRKVTLT